MDKKIESQVVNLKKKLDHLKEMHSNMSKSNNKQVFLFCLDSFYFQYKLFSMDLENLNKFNLLMKNRMYCDYYKLYKLILKYMNDNKDIISITEVIDNNAYKNEKAYNLSKALLNISTLARAVKYTASQDIRENGMMAIDNVNDWMTEILDIANNAVREEMLTEKL